MDLGPLAYRDVLHVARNMREWDRREVYAGRWNDEPEDVAADIAFSDSFGYVAKWQGRPVAVIGARSTHPGVWSVFMFATDDFRQISLSLTKFAKRVMIPSVAHTGAHRADCYSMEGHTEAHRWLDLLGARREHTRYGYGRNGEDFHCYVWRRQDVLRP